MAREGWRDRATDLSSQSILMYRFISIILTLVFFVPSFAFAQISSNTRSYLHTLQNNPWVLMAHVAAGDAVSVPSIDRESVFTFSKSLLAFVAAGGSPDKKLTQSFIDAYYTHNQIGNPEYVNDDFWGLLALRSAGVPADDLVIRDTRSFIVGAQRPNGGWSWSPTYPIADTDDTAAAIMALLESGVASSDPAIQRALAYLQSAQNRDGGFSNVPPGKSSIESTAWVVSALWKVGANPNTWTHEDKDAMIYLRAQEKTDGSFGGAAATASVVIALAGKSYPVRSYVAPVVLSLQQDLPRPVEVPYELPAVQVQQQPLVIEKVPVKKVAPVQKKIVKKAVRKSIKKAKPIKQKSKKKK